MFAQPISKKTPWTAWMITATVAFAMLFLGGASVLVLATDVDSEVQPALQPQAAPGVTRNVTITPGANPDDPPTVTPDAVEVWPNDQVEWKCSTGCDFDVVFVESGKKPFKNRGFNKSRNKSGKPTGAPGTYKYIIIVGGGVLDPDVIIKGGA